MAPGTQEQNTIKKDAQGYQFASNLSRKSERLPKYKKNTNYIIFEDAYENDGVLMKDCVAVYEKI